LQSPCFALILVNRWFRKDSTQSGREEGRAPLHFETIRARCDCWAHSLCDETLTRDLRLDGILPWFTGRKRGRLLSYRRYLAILSEGPVPVPVGSW